MEVSQSPVSFLLRGVELPFVEQLTRNEDFSVRV
jgi:hypothetical protein